jgi:hypothetical protein
MNNYPLDYSKETPETVKKILESYLYKDVRIRLFLGDNKTGLDWNEEYGTMGYIGKSTGTKPVLILLNNARSNGGGAILTGCIVKISVGGRTLLYQHPYYHSKSFTVKNSDIPGYAESVYDNENNVVARFEKSGQGQRWVDFITGKRNNK